MKIRICRMQILMYKSVRMRMRILKKLKYDTIYTDNMIQSTNITQTTVSANAKLKFKHNVSCEPWSKWKLFTFRSLTNSQCDKSVLLTSTLSKVYV